MTFKTLDTSEYKTLYFHRTEEWDWHTSAMIKVIDSKNPRVITMDPWPQKIFLEALGHITVEEYVHKVAKEYPKGNVPADLDVIILQMLEDLVYGEKVVSFSEIPVTIEPSILNPSTEEGEITLKGTWNGTYQYTLPDEFKDDKMIDVKFTLKIDRVKGQSFSGTVEDDLSSGGTPGIGIIKGTFDKNSIYFTKKMPVLSQVDATGKHTNNTNKKHPTLVYEGAFSRSKHIITGTWEFKSKTVVWNGLIPSFVSGGQGTFVMSKDKK